MARRYATGARREITPEWIARANDALMQRGKGKLRWLEQKAKLARGAASKILSGSQQTSNHLDAISKVLGIEAPPILVENDEEIRLLERFRAMTPRARVHLLGILGDDRSDSDA